ncbi:MAG: hypothetical protein HQL32_12535 [Planctomycetes bacterium]|nr:hypothetical protein [Planctomycetota bacterium]
MNKFKQLAVILLATAFPLIGFAAEMPKELKGTWILDAKASEAYIQTSPKWKPKDAKYLPKIMKRMSQVLYTFKDDSIIAAMRGKEQAFPITSVEREGENFLCKGNIKGKEVTLTVSLRKDGVINIKSSTTDDMDYYIWKRGELSKEK